jgi:biofilm PGA synthesis N-glycosyltransferase PgaC
MIWLKILVVAALLVYTIFMLVSIFALLFAKKDPDFTKFTPLEKISIIVPFRNEEHTIVKCLESLAGQDFPKELLELILVDDNSEDDTKKAAEIFLHARSFTYQLIDLKTHNLSGKKAAIELAVAKASSSIIITRDADTYTKSSRWLKSIAYEFVVTKPKLLVAPVMLSGTSFIQLFQRFENLAISSIGYVFAKKKLPFVCSGANLAYRKDSFLQVNPYKDNLHIASGDDMFLLQSFKEAKFSINTIKNPCAIAYTKAEKDVPSFINQRLRWAGKTKNMRLKTAWFIGSLLFLTNLAVLITAFLAVFSGTNIKFCLFTLIYKCIIDFLLLFLGAIMYKQKLNFAFYIPAFMANLFYTPFIAVAAISVKPSWKGRKIGV